jgi:hypothetical protein
VQDDLIPEVSHGFDLYEYKDFTIGKHVEKFLRNVFKNLLKAIFTVVSEKTSSQFS